MRHVHPPPEYDDWPPDDSECEVCLKRQALIDRICDAAQDLEPRGLSEERPTLMQAIDELVSLEGSDAPSQEQA